MKDKILLWTFVMLILVGTVTADWVTDDLQDDADNSNIDWDLSNAEVNSMSAPLVEYYMNGYDVSNNAYIKSGNVSYDLGFHNSSFLFRVNNTETYGISFGLGSNAYDTSFEYKVQLHPNKNTYIELPDGSSYTYGYQLGNSDSISNGTQDWLFQFNYYDDGGTAVNNYTLNISYRNVSLADDFGELTDFTPLFNNQSLNGTAWQNFTGLRAKVVIPKNYKNNSIFLNYSSNVSDSGTGISTLQAFNITYYDVNLLNELMVYYKFDDENTSNNGTDIIEPAYTIVEGAEHQTNGTIGGGVLTGQASMNTNFEECYYLDGEVAVDDDYIKFSINIDDLKNRSMNVWINLEADQEHWIFRPETYDLSLKARDTAFTVRDYRGLYGGSNAADTMYSSDGTAPLEINTWSYSTWYMVTLVYDYDNKNRSMFINGVLVNESIGTLQQLWANGSTNMYIGNAADSTMKGYIDEFAFWNKTLNTTFVSELYNSGTGANVTDFTEDKAYIRSIYYNYTYLDVYKGGNTTLYLNLTNIPDEIISLNSTLFYDTGVSYEQYTITYNTNQDYAEIIYFIDNVGEYGTHEFTPAISFYDNEYNYTSGFTNSLSVLDFSISNCSGYENAVLQLNFFEENKTNQFMNSTAEVNLDYWFGDSTNTFNYSTILYGQPDNWSICIDPLNASIQANLYVRHWPKDNLGFVNKYYAFNTTLNNNTQNISLYAYNGTTDISDLKLTLRKTTTYQYFDNVLAKLYRFYVNEGVWREVQHSLSDDFGLLFFNVKEEDVDYKLYFYDTNNNLLETTNTLKFVCDSTICELSYLLDPYTSVSFEGDISINQVYDNETGYIHLNWSDSEGDSRTVTTVISTLQGIRQRTICNFTQQGVIGNVSCDVSAYKGDIYVNVYATGSWLSIFSKIVSLPLQKLDAVIPRVEGAFWSMLLITGIILTGLISPVVALISSVFGLIIVYKLGILSVITTGFITIACIVAIVISFKVKK